MYDVNDKTPEGPKPKVVMSKNKDIERLRKENKKLRKQLLKNATEEKKLFVSYTFKTDTGSGEGCVDFYTKGEIDIKKIFEFKETIEKILIEEQKLENVNVVILNIINLSDL